MNAHANNMLRMLCNYLKIDSEEAHRLILSTGEVVPRFIVANALSSPNYKFHLKQQRLNNRLFEALLSALVELKKKDEEVGKDLYSRLQFVLELSSAYARQLTILGSSSFKINFVTHRGGPVHRSLCLLEGLSIQSRNNMPRKVIEYQNSKFIKRCKESADKEKSSMKRAST